LGKLSDPLAFFGRGSGLPTKTQLSAWHDQVRDRALTTLLIVQCLLIFVAVPIAPLGIIASRLIEDIVAIVFAILVVFISRGLAATLIASVAVIFALAGSLLHWLMQSTEIKILAHAGSLGASIVVAYVVGRAVFGPGKVTGHRVRGAIVLYLDFGMIFATGYRVLWDLSPGSLSGLSAASEHSQVASTILYFSFVTLSSLGFGDIIPIHPIARSLANLEGIIGQLYPATLLARLITLELETSRR
jgi:hypothetical protein